MLFSKYGDMASFSTSSVAKDVATFMGEYTTGEDTIVYGLSYGTALGEWLMHLDPPEVTEYVLDGIAGSRTNEFQYFSSWDPDFGEVADRFLAMNQEDEEIAARFKKKGLAGTIKHLIAKFDNDAFEKLLHNHASIADQCTAIAGFSNDCAVAFHALGPLNDTLLPLDSANSKMFKSRKGRFALSKASMVEFIKENDPASLPIINGLEAPFVDLVGENLAICAVNMIESLLELSIALGKEQNSSDTTSRPNDPKVTEFLPPTLPHELAQLSGREFDSLLRTYSPMVRSFLSEEDIEMMDQELQGLRRGAVRESALSAALANCNADTPFKEAWALTERRFKLLECFAGGFASVYSCTPIATRGSTGDLALCRSEMDMARVLLADFALEGSLHAQQFPALLNLNEKLEAESI